VEAGSAEINNVNVNTSMEDSVPVNKSGLELMNMYGVHSRWMTLIDPALYAVRCPDSLIIKNRLTENKDKLLHKSIDWNFEDERHDSWQNGDNLSLM
jgi:hypothetical protein